VNDQSAGESRPHLSVIIPALNEVEHLPGLVEGVFRQQGDLSIEVVVCDGGSTDGTLDACRQRIAGLDRRGLYRDLVVGAGRARQMNAGARVSTGGDLLFLHADSEIHDARLLVNAYEAMVKQREQLGQNSVAGHFCLRFVRSTAAHARAYFFYEAKTCLDRPGCINGDQGFWLPREFFARLGGFDESLDYMEDARLADRIFSTGQWVSLPGAIFTSARRFEREGLAARQTLNALISALDAVGLDDFFHMARHAYRQQDRTDRLDLYPFFQLVHRLVVQRGLREALRLWFAVGRFVAGNAWQVAYLVDCRKMFSRNGNPDQVSGRWLSIYDRHLARWIESVPGACMTMLLTAGWFYTWFFRVRILRQDAKAEQPAR
jgi:glycosyltransferase involved in cell wall biosynthesis